MANGVTTPMTEAAFEKSLAAINAVLRNADAAPGEVAAAQEALDRITVARNRFFVERISARTAFLNDLSVQLGGVIAAMAENPLGGVLSQLNGAVSAVNAALGPET